MSPLGPIRYSILTAVSSFLTSSPVQVDRDRKVPEFLPIQYNRYANFLKTIISDGKIAISQFMKEIFNSVTIPRKNNKTNYLLGNQVR